MAGPRAKNGRVEKGWKGGPGNPRAKHMWKLAEAARSAVTEQERHDAIRKLYAKWDNEEDLDALKILFERCMGKPLSEKPPGPLGLEHCPTSRRPRVVLPRLTPSSRLGTRGGSAWRMSFTPA